MPDTPNSQLGAYTAQDIANEIIKRRPDLQGQDPDALVHQLIQARPEFQPYLKTSELQRFVNPYQAKPEDTGIIPGAKRAAKGLYEFFSGQAHSLFDEPRTPEEAQAAHQIEQEGGNSAYYLYLKRTSIDPGEASRKAAAESAAKGDNLGVIQHSAEAALGYLGPTAVVSPSGALRSVIAPQIVGAAAGRAGQGDITGGATEAALGLFGPHIISKGLQAIRPMPIPGVPAELPVPRTAPSAAPTETAPLPSTQAPPAPQTFTGLDSPMRPWDPTGTRFQRGGTPGLPTITGEPPAVQAPVVSPAEHIAASGMVNRGQLMRNEGPFGVEHPDFRNVTASINPQDVTSPDAVKQAVARKLNEVADNPPGPVPGQPTLDPVALRNAAQQLQPSAIGRPTPTPEAAQLNLPDFESSEKAEKLVRDQRWYNERLTNPDLIKQGIQLSDGRFAVPVGGSRVSGLFDAVGDPEYANGIVRELKDRPGFPNVRVHGDAAQGYEIRWGLPFSDETGRTDATSGSWERERGIALGYKPELVERYAQRNFPSIQNAPLPSSPTVQAEPIRSFDLGRFHSQMDAVERAEANLAGPNQTFWQQEKWKHAVANLRQDFKSGLTDFVRRVDPDSTDAVRDQLSTESTRLREQVKEIQDVRTQNSTAKAMRSELSNSRPIRPWRMEIKVEGQEGYQEVGNQFPGELRDAFHKILGDKTTTEGGIPPEAMDEVKGKAQEGLKNAREALTQRMEDIASRTGDANIPKSELVDKALREEKRINGRDLLSEVRDLQSILGTQRERLRYASKGEPVVDEQGVVRAPGNVKELSLKWANAVLNRTLRKLPDDAAWDKITTNLERRASFLDTVSRKLTPKEPGSEAGFIGETSHAGGRISSEEELARPGRFVKISRSGLPTDQGKVPDFNLREGEAGYQVRPDGSVELKAGQETAATKTGVQRYTKEVYGKQRGVSGIELMASSSALGTAGAAIGAHVAGAPGAVIGGAAGYAAGFVLPALYRHPAVASILSDLTREVRDLGFDTAKNAYSVGESLVNAVSPKAGVNADTVNLLFKMKGEIAKEAFLAPKLLDSYRRTAEALPDEARIDFIDRYKQGIQQTTPELQALADTIKQIDRQDFSDIQKYRPGVPFLENHFRLLYKVIPGRDEAGFTSFVGKRPLSGGGGFLHQHTFDTLSEAMQAGGEPVTTNPVDLFLLSHLNVTRFVEANKMWEDAQYKNLRQYVQKGMTAPSNFVRLSDPISKVFFRAASGEGLVNPGEWWVEKGFGRLLENSLSRDRIRESVLGKAVVDIKNIATGVELFGPFHAVFVNNAMASMELGNSLQRVWNLGVRKGDVGQIAQGVKEAGTAAADFVRGPSGMLSAGRAVISGKSLPESLLPGPYAEGSAIKEFGTALEKSRRLNDPQALQDFVNSDRGQKFLQKFPGAEGLFNDVFQGGLNVNLDEGMRSNIIKSMTESFKDKRYISAAAKVPGAAMYQAMRPLFDEYIPNLKLGMFMRDMSLQLKDRASEILDGSLTREELSRQVARRTENVFGEMNFDNLFWNRTMKTSLQMLYRSVTWRFGTLDVAKNALLGQGSAIVDAAKTRTLPRIDPNAAYFAGEMLLTGALAAVTMRALSSKYPSSFQDLLHPQTGEVDERGKPIRVDIPTYLSKNISGMVQDFPQGVIKYATGGRSTPIQKFLESWNNKDFYGKFVANPNDPEYSQFVQRVVHLLPSLMVTGTMDRLEQEGAGPGRKLLAFGGYTPTPRGLDLTPAEKKAQELMSAKLPAGGRYDYDFNHSNTMKRVIAGIRNGQDVSPTILDGLQSGTLKIDDLKPTKLLPRLTQPYLAQMSRRLSLEEFLTVYDKATPQEREQLNPLITTKLGELLKMDPTRRDQTVSRLKSLTQ